MRVGGGVQHPREVKRGKYKGKFTIKKLLRGGLFRLLLAGSKDRNSLPRRMKKGETYKRCLKRCKQRAKDARELYFPFAHS